jgi:hypothetical protein
MSFTVDIGWFRLGTAGKLYVSKQLVLNINDPKKGSWTFRNMSPLLVSWRLLNAGPLLKVWDLRNQFNAPFKGGWQLLNTLVEEKWRSWLLLNDLDLRPKRRARWSLRNNLYDLESASLEWGDFGPVADEGPGAATGDFDILIDGVSVKGQVLDCTIVMDEGQFANTCNLSLADVDLWPDLEPDLSGDLRIEVKIGTVHYFFMLEERSDDAAVDRNTIGIWGRSKTALLDAPYSSPLTTELEATKLASEIVADLAPDFTVDWGVLDYYVGPGSIEQLGRRPLEVIAELAGGVRGIVRCSPEGDLVIRYKHPEDLATFGAATPDYFFNDYDDVVTLTQEFNSNQLANAVLVEQQTTSGVGLSGSIEVDRDLSPTVLAGTAFHVRVYLIDTPDQSQYPSWPDGFYSLDLSQGSAVFVGTITREEEELVTILNGSGSVRYPIASLVALDWQTEDLGGLDFAQGSQDLKLTSGADENGLVKLTYRTVYDSWRINPPLTKEAVLVVSLKDES